MYRKISAFLVVSFVLAMACPIRSVHAGKKSVVFPKNTFKILLSAKEPEPLKLAVQTLLRDCETVMGFRPEVVDSLEKAGRSPLLMVINDSTRDHTTGPGMPRPLLDFEAHRVSVDPEKNIVYLQGFDMRGTIYAVYTFSEKFLCVPPLWYFCSWKPETLEQILVPRDTNLLFPSPQVRYRAWFPNDTDMFSPWRKLSQDNDTLWLETMLRLKLNTVELGSTIRYPGKMSFEAEKLARFGLVLTSHHMIALNSGFNNWGTYWKNVRKEPAPPLLLANEKELIAFFRYNVETVARSGIENLWQIAFRGDGDKPFWATFADAPAGEPERAEVINKMLRIQLDLIKEITGEKEPYVRMTFYDELSDLLASGLLKPPTEKNMIWTFCSARRDHYPNDDLVGFDTKRAVKLGYYMNLQFTSTGSHLAPAEGPWKMEANYRYVNGRAPLYFSVVNAGNLREHLFSMSANAALLWDFNTYDTDRFVLDYCETYFGKEHGAAVARLYKEFFYSYWEPTRSSFPGMERQFLFHDLRYNRALRFIGEKFFEYNPNPLRDIGFERMPGRSFRITPSDNGAEDTVGALLNGMAATAPKFEQVAARCDALYPKLPEAYQPFLNDNLRGYARFMGHLSRMLYHYVHAYKHQADREILINDLRRSAGEMEKANAALLETQHGVFEHWYDGDAKGGKFNMLQTLKRINDTLKKAEKSPNAR